MQKKDFLWNLLAIAMVGLLSISFISCGDDDEPVSQPQKEQPNNTNDPNKPDDSNNPSTTIDAICLFHGIKQRRQLSQGFEIHRMAYSTTSSSHIRKQTS